nr:peptide deformylase [Tropheryma whipplei]
MSQDGKYTGCNTHSNTHSAQDREKEGAVPKISGGKILPIYITGHAVLHAPAKPVTDFSGIQEIVRDMFATMFAAPGVGLAGPQIGLGLRIFVYSYTEGDTLHQGVAINPDLLIPKGVPKRQTHKQQANNSTSCDEPDREGCLSFPGYQFPLERAPQVTLSAFDENKKPFTVHATGWLARIFQHEFDHLQGTLYVDRLAQKYSGEVRQAVLNNKWGIPGKYWVPQEPKE